MAEKCLIEKSKKRRVIGDNGPRRYELKEYGVIDTNVPQEVINEILSIAGSYNGNDLGGDNYQISQHCDVSTAFTASAEYKQILLQNLDAEDEIDETGYTAWRDDIECSAIKKYLTETYKQPYRARVSVLPPGNDLNWHIDTDTSVLCRAQIPAFHKGSLFQWKTKTGVTEVEMEPGKAYFVNTGWTHRVENQSSNVRIVLIFGIDYDNIPDKTSITL